MGFAEGLIKDRTGEEGCQRPVQPDQEDDDGTDGAIDDGIIAHIIDIVGKKEGICHPCRRGKERAGKHITDAGTFIGGQGIDRGGEQDQRQRHGQETDLVPEGDEFHCNRKELGNKAEEPFPNDQQDDRCRNEDQDQDIEKEYPGKMALLGFFPIDIGNFGGHIFHRAEGKPQGEGQTEGQDGTVGIGGHMDKGDI